MAPEVLALARPLPCPGVPTAQWSGEGLVLQGPCWAEARLLRAAVTLGGDLPSESLGLLLFQEV